MEFEMTEPASVEPAIISVAVIDGDSSREKVEISVDDALKRSGLGRFQWLSFVLLAGIQVFFGYQIVNSYFIASDPAWKCVRNDTSEFCMQNYGKDIYSDNSMFPARCTLDRNEWTYSTHKTFSIVTEFDLICDKTWLAAFMGSVFHIGAAIGFSISGLAADHYGRKYVLVAFLGVLTVSSILCSYATSIWQLLILRAIIGAGYNSSYSISYVYLSEIVPPRHRMLSGVGYCMGFTFSELLVDLVAYLCRYWRMLVLYLALPVIIGIILIFTLPESPRWSAVNNRKPEAEKALARIANINKKPLPPFNIKSSNLEGGEKYTFKHLFNSKQAATLTLSLGFMWFTIALTFYEIAFESSALGGSMYQAFAITTIAEIPSKFVAIYVCDRFGRRKSLIASLICAIAFLGAQIIIPKGFIYKYTFNIVLMMFARFFGDINIQCIHMWGSELFPTVIRLQGVGVCNVFERLGTFAVPFLVNVLLPVKEYLPHVILICLMVICVGIAHFILPETSKQPTRERYEDFFITTVIKKEKRYTSEDNSRNH